MDESYLFSAVRYIELNPIRAGLCKAAQAWQWSSAQAHLNGVDDELVKVGPMLERVGDWPDFLASYKDSCDLELLELHERTGRPLGPDPFIDHLEKISGRILRPLKPGPKKI